jgi:hypothetical protein
MARVSHVCMPLGRESPQDAWYAYFRPGGPFSALGGYMDASTKEFVANYAAGARWPGPVGGNDTQADALAHMIPVVARWGICIVHVRVCVCVCVCVFLCVSVCA